jgi:hypothetical protein
MMGEGKVVALGVFTFISMNVPASTHSARNDIVIIHVVRRIQTNVLRFCPISRLDRLPIAMGNSYA